MALPDLEDAITNLQHQEVDAAISTLEEKIEALPAHLTAHVLLARAHEAKHNWQHALQYWENVRFLMPSSPVGREGKKRVLRHLNQGDGAPSSADPAVQDAPSAADASDAPDAPTEGTDSEEESPSDAAPASPSEPEPPPEPDDADESDRPTSDDTTGPASGVTPDLDQLRRRTEEEAQQGGARPELADAASASGPEASSAETPEERVDQMDEEEDSLDRLIDKLESAQIDPDPDVEDVPEPDLEDDVDDIVSETLARIHESQGDYRKAAKIYLKLAAQEPDETRPYLEKAAQMREKSDAETSDRS